MIRNAEEILSLLEQHEEVLRRLGVKRLGLFGSAARGEASASGDLDFVVEFERKTFDAYMDLKMLLEDLFGGPVDLVPIDQIKPRLRERILGETQYAPGL